MRNHKGSKNPNWKGDKAKYEALHRWVGRHKKKPKCCERCGKKTKELDKHNISGKYTRDLDDWIYVCKKCNKELDKLNKENKKDNKCLNEHLEEVELWRKNNPDKVKAINKKHNNKNKAKYKIWWEENKEEINTKKRIEYQNNPDKAKESNKKSYEKYKDERNAKAKIDYENLDETKKNKILAKAKIRWDKQKDEINLKRRNARQNLSKEEREEKKEKN